MSGGTAQRAGVADRKGHIDCGWLLALSKQPTPSPRGQYCYIVFHGGQRTGETTILEKAFPTVQISSPTQPSLMFVTGIRLD